MEERKNEPHYNHILWIINMLVCVQSLSLGPNPLDCGVNNGCYKKRLPQSHSAINLYALFCVLCDMAVVLWCFATWQLSLCTLRHGNCPCLLCDMATVFVCFVTWQLPLCALQCYCSNSPCMLCDSNCPCFTTQQQSLCALWQQLSLGVLCNSATVFVCFATRQLSLCALQLSSCPCVLFDSATVLVCFVTWLQFSFFLSFFNLVVIQLLVQ